jgi:hypothetical protein
MIATALVMQIFMQPFMNTILAHSAYAANGAPKAQSPAGPTQASAPGLTLSEIDTMPSFPVSYQHDGIDIYPPVASDDGDNHYIHIDIENGENIFKYCKNGVPIWLAKKGAHPVNRDCYLTLGRATGYTVAEIQSEAKSSDNTYWDETEQQIATTAVTSTVIFLSLGAIDVFTEGADAPADPAEAVAERAALDRAGPEIVADAEKAVKVIKVSRMAKFLSHLKTNFLKATMGGVITTGVSSGVGSFTSRFKSAQIDDYNNSSPAQVHLFSQQMISAMTAPSCVYITDDSIQTFAHKTTSVLDLVE